MLLICEHIQSDKEDNNSMNSENIIPKPKKFNDQNKWIRCNDYVVHWKENDNNGFTG